MENLLSLCFIPNIVVKAQVTHTATTNTDAHYSKALPSKIDYEILFPYLHLDHMISYRIYCGKLLNYQSVLSITLCNVILKVLQHKCLNKIIATVTYSASDKSIGYYCAQVFLL